MVDDGDDAVAIGRLERQRDTEIAQPVQDAGGVGGGVRISDVGPGA